MMKSQLTVVFSTQHHPVIHTYIHKCMHAYIHTYIYIYIYKIALLNYQRVWSNKWSNIFGEDTREAQRLESTASQLRGKAERLQRGIHGAVAPWRPERWRPVETGGAKAVVVGYAENMGNIWEICEKKKVGICWWDMLGKILW